MEIVGHEEAAAEAIFAQRPALLVGESPFAHLDGVEPRPVVSIAFLEVHGLLHGADVNAGQAADGLGKMPVGARVVLGPE